MLSEDDAVADLYRLDYIVREADQAVMGY